MELEQYNEQKLEELNFLQLKYRIKFIIQL